MEKKNYMKGMRQRTREILIWSGSYPAQKKSTVTTTKCFEQPEDNRKKQKKRAVLTRKSSSQHRNSRHGQAEAISCIANVSSSPVQS